MPQGGQKRRKKRGVREIYFKLSANIIVETGKYSLQAMLAGQKPREELWFASEGRLLTDLPLLCGRTFFLLRSSTDCRRLTLIMEDSLLYKSVHIVMLISPTKITSWKYLDMCLTKYLCVIA